MYLLTSGFICVSCYLSSFNEHYTFVRFTATLLMFLFHRYCAVSDFWFDCVLDTKVFSTWVLCFFIFGISTTWWLFLYLVLWVLVKLFYLRCHWNLLPAQFLFLITFFIFVGTVTPFLLMIYSCPERSK